MANKRHFSAEQAKAIGDRLGIDWSRFDVEEFRRGMEVELEHGTRDPATDVTGDDPILTGKIHGTRVSVANTGHPPARRSGVDRRR